MELYLVTDEELLEGKDFFKTIEDAVKGGVTMVQLREKQLCTKDFCEKAIALKKLLRPYNVPLIINDRIDIALACDADGVHIGQSDMPYSIARKILGKNKIIGLSVENKEEVILANSLDVDYIAASPVFSTPTKTNTIIQWGIDGIEWIRKNSKHPLVAIGRMNSDTISDTITAGADSVAVVSAIISSENPMQSAKELSQIIKTAKTKR